jgi:hypothetical protein
MRRLAHALVGIAAAVAAGLSLAVALGAGAAAQRPDPFGDASADLVREPSIGYFTDAANDPVAKLQQQIQAGTVQLRFDPGQGYLRSILDALRLRIDSQLLVFSKTSVQAPHINPRNPRAIYFNDSVAIGFIPGADFLEFAAQDPRQGIVFYTLDQQRAERPTIDRRDFCLQCHYGYATLSVPGMLTRSVVTTPTGSTLPQFGNAVSDHNSPLAERWAGWYATGTHGSMRHLGNAMIVNREDPEAMVGPHTLNVISLGDRFDAGAYPSAASDITALLVFDHQMRMMNLLTRIGWEVRLAIARHGDAAARARAMATEVVDYLLFIDEAPLAAPVRGTSGFASRFSAEGPRDRRGRSLRELALDGRLLRHSCSYMIYSEAFDALPVEARDAIYRRLWQVLSGAEPDARYARLTPADRRAILEILRDTKNGLPAYFSGS